MRRGEKQYDGIILTPIGWVRRGEVDPSSSHIGATPKATRCNITRGSEEAKHVLEVERCNIIGGSEGYSGEWKSRRRRQDIPTVGTVRRDSGAEPFR